MFRHCGGSLEPTTKLGVPGAISRKTFRPASMNGCASSRILLLYGAGNFYADHWRRMAVDKNVGQVKLEAEFCFVSPNQIQGLI
jgi:hypothetical protein